MFNALKGRDPFAMDDLEDSRRKLLAAIVTNAFAYGIALTVSAISFRFIVFSNTTLRISRRYWLLAHTALIVALATVYCAFILLEQTNFLLSQIIPTVVEYWKPGNVALVMWGANVWTADGFMLFLEVWAWRRNVPFAWVSSVLYLGYLATSALGLLANAGKFFNICFIISLVIHVFSFLLFIARVIRTYRTRRRQKLLRENSPAVVSEEEIEKEPSERPIPAFLMNGGVYVMARLAWIVSIWVGGAAYWADSLVIAGACVAPHLVVMHVILRPSSEAERLTVETVTQDELKEASVEGEKGIDTIATVENSRPVRTISPTRNVTSLSNSLVKDMKGFNFWSRQ